MQFDESWKNFIALDQVYDDTVLQWNNQINAQKNWRGKLKKVMAVIKMRNLGGFLKNGF